MRARGLRPSFDSLDPRITPTDPSPVVPTLPPPVVVPAPPSPGPMPGGDTTVNNNLGDWQVGGTPQNPPVNVLLATVDTSTWVVVAP